MFTRFCFFWSPTLLRLHFLWYKSLQKLDFFDHLSPSSCKRSFWTVLRWKMAEVWAVKIQKFIRKQNSLKLSFPWKRSVPVAQLQFEEDSTRGEEDAKKGYHGSMHFGQNSVGDGVTPSVRTYGLRPPDGLCMVDSTVCSVLGFRKRSVASFLLCSL